jgi:hypothetical protein
VATDLVWTWIKFFITFLKDRVFIIRFPKGCHLKFNNP